MDLANLRRHQKDELYKNQDGGVTVTKKNKVSNFIFDHSTFDGESILGYWRDAKNDWIWKEKALDDVVNLLFWEQFKDPNGSKNRVFKKEKKRTLCLPTG